MLRLFAKDELDTEDAAEMLMRLAADLRPADLDEIAATSGEDADMALAVSWDLSSCAWIAVDEEGNPVVAMGAAPTPAPGVGAAWLLGANRMAAHRHQIARLTAPYVAEMHEDYPVLWNYIDARNEASLRWLRWAGFHLIEANLEHGPERRLFYQFARHA